MDYESAVSTLIADSKLTASASLARGTTINLSAIGPIVKIEQIDYVLLVEQMINEKYMPWNRAMEYALAFSNLYKARFRVYKMNGTQWQIDIIS